MNIKIELKETSAPIIIDDAKNAYTKGLLYCVYRSDNTVVKIPLCNIFRIVEDYVSSTSQNQIVKKNKYYDDFFNASTGTECMFSEIEA